MSKFSQGRAACASPSACWITGVLLALACACGTVNVRAFAASGDKEKPKKKKKADKKEAVQEVALVKPKPNYPPYAPSMREKNEDALHNYIVDFEAVYAKAEPHFAVDEFTKHDYDACTKSVEPMERSAKGLEKIHEDRLRQFGNDYHHQLEALSATLQQLRSAVKEHRRSDIFTYWAQLKMLRDTFSMTTSWQDETTVWPPEPPPPEKNEKKKE